MSLQGLLLLAHNRNWSSEISSVPRKISFEVVALGFITILCAALSNLYHLGAASLWSDADVFALLRRCVWSALRPDRRGCPRRRTLPRTISCSLRPGLRCGAPVKQRCARCPLWPDPLRSSNLFARVANWPESRWACLVPSLRALPDELVFCSKRQGFMLLSTPVGAALLWAAAVFLRDASAP